MKKIVSIILTALIMLSCVTAFAGSDTDMLFTQLSKLTKEQRAEYFSFAKPYFVSDFGVDVAIDNIESGAFASMFEGFFGSDVDEDMLKRVFLSVKCVNQATRERYISIIQNKTPLANASSETTNGVQKILKALYSKSSAAKQVLTEDGYTASVVANILTIFPTVNGGPNIAFENNEFSVGTINQTFARSFNAVWSGYEKPVTAYSLADSLVQLLEGVPTADKPAVAKSLSNLGICNITVIPDTPQGGGTGADAPVTDTEKTDNYVVIKSAAGVPESIFKNSVVVKTAKNIPAVIEILVESDNPLVKKLDSKNKLETIKYSIPTEKGIMLCAEPETIYVISTHTYPFNDANGWGKSYIAALNARGIINGKEQNLFMPDENIKREEFIKLVVELFGLLDEKATADFSDVSADTWYAPYVKSAKQAGITNGLGDGSFGVGKNITRQDMAKIISTVLSSYNIVSTEVYYKFNDSADISSYAQEHIQKIANLGIISGDDNKNFNPKKFATRQEAAKMVYGMLNCYILHN